MEIVSEEATRDLAAELERYKIELEKARVALDAENGEKVRQVLAREKIEQELNETQRQYEEFNVLKSFLKRNHRL